MKSWYLLYCKRGEQKRAKQHLENQQVECYYPEIEIEKILRGKRQRVVEPLFPSYMFVALDHDNGPTFTTIRSTRGVMDFVRFGGLPYKVPKGVIERLQNFKPDEEGTTLPKQGQTVQITSGQFAGFDAVYHESDGEKRSILLITLINKQVKIKVDNTQVDW
ncbi:transcription/translation regulatory transformer protein RfaH [Vibrio gangliei]|uniref:transcription/translation regulatory transformer protein RfaH n=1 Tax=Vibrio gangliei TaxID=2077090 RepID=UPI000D0122A3|nr:transcription/translation regulatory transformer protein RfaH [Vibrio gangliei]